MDIDKRFERILAIYFLLQSKPVVKAQELADKFEVSLRTIYRDIKSLEKAGVPIYSEAGLGYALVNGYKLPPTLFTKDEAMSFALAEKLMQQYLDKGVAQQFSNAITKMRAVLRNTDKENVQKVEQQVQIINHNSSFNIEVPKALNILMESIAHKKQVILQYQKSVQEIAQVRNIEPIGVFQENSFWYFMAYCHLRKAVRQFRLDRVQNIELSEADFQESLQSLSYYLDQKSKNAANMQQVVIWASATMHRFMYWDRAINGFVSEKPSGEGFEMTFAYNPKYPTLHRWLLIYGEGIKILEPQSFKSEMLTLLQSIQKHLE